ncbi:MAG: DegT/DnrJ/EryC1/StrS family aminotransferase [Candidatus Lernaella stagnicola]|nr:DegT/DnrJ/EryC1/StrS family aminotransferase [Candidatus Lernaella stagnicola]
MTDKNIDLVKPTLADWREIEPLFAAVWESGRLTLGPHTKAFEDAAAQQMNVRHAIAVSSCTSGLMLAIRALELTGEIIIPSFTWASTGHSVVWNGLRPVFADIEPGTYTMDPEDVAQRITPATSAIMTANAFGLYPDMDALNKVAEEAGIVLLCDSAQAIGAKYNDRIGGGLCAAEIFSFSPTKVVTAVEGGLVTTNDDELAVQLRNMRDYGKSSDGTDVESFGLSARLSEFHSIVGLSNLRRVEELIAAREAIVAHYRELLAGIPGMHFQTIPEGRRSSHNYFVVFLDPDRYDRDDVWRGMAAAQVQTKRYFYPALHRQGSYRDFPPPEPPLPVTERAASDALALPLYSHMSRDETEQVCARLRRVLRDA